MSYVKILGHILRVIFFWLMTYIQGVISAKVRFSNGPSTISSFPMVPRKDWTTNHESPCKRMWPYHYGSNACPLISWIKEGKPVRDSEFLYFQPNGNGRVHLVMTFFNGPICYLTYQEYETPRHFFIPSHLPSVYKFHPRCNHLLPKRKIHLDFYRNFLEPIMAIGWCNSQWRNSRKIVSTSFCL